MKKYPSLPFPYTQAREKIAQEMDDDIAKRSQSPKRFSIAWKFAANPPNFLSSPLSENYWWKIFPFAVSLAVSFIKLIDEITAH